jgi:hypothetical protein
MEDVFDLGLLDLVDLVTVHLYFGGQPQPAPENNYYIEPVKTLVAGYDPNMPIACSEWGYIRYIEGIETSETPVTEEQQRDYLPRCYLLSSMWGLRFNTWYAWNLMPPSHHAGYGLRSGPSTFAPAYYAMVNMTAQLPDATFVQRIDIPGKPNDYVLKFDTSSGVRYAVWTTGSAHDVSFDVGSEVATMSSSDITGDTTTNLVVNSGTVTTNASEAVQYLYSAPRFDFFGFAVLASHWMDIDCAINNDCRSYDFEPDGDVDIYDLETFCDAWLTGL